MSINFVFPGRVQRNIFEISINEACTRNYLSLCVCGGESKKENNKDILISCW